MDYILIIWNHMLWKPHFILFAIKAKRSLFFCCLTWDLEGWAYMADVTVASFQGESLKDAKRTYGMGKTPDTYAWLKHFNAMVSVQSYEAGGARRSSS